MKSNKYLSVVSLAVLGLCCTRSAFAQLKATAFPGTFQDVPFSQRVQTKAAGYEPYKDMKAYVIPEFKKTDQKFKDEMCERDREECCRRWPDYKNNVFSCLPQIIYEMYGGSKAKCKGTAPESYYTPKGATITCVPERKRSKFLGWCKDAGLTDCDMMQTIAPGEKDDKFFWAKWECIDTSYIMTQTSCDCPDVNMDDNCQCTGRGMSPTPNTDGKCECVSLNAHVQDGECVCDNDPSYDPTTDCTEPEPEPCSDPVHMDETDDCQCIPKGKTHEDGGICVCDNGLDIDNDCDPATPPPPSKNYKLYQCRAKSGTMNDYLDGNALSSSVGAGAKDQYIQWSTLLGSKGLNCGVRNRDTYDKCFIPCQKSTTKTGIINTELSGIIDDFCSCNWGNTKKGHVWYFADINNPTIDKDYSKAEVDAVMAKFNAHGGDYYPECDVDNSTWYVIAFETDLSNKNKIKYYKHFEIGH